MKVSLDFVPAYCPSCGQPLPRMTRQVLKEFLAGEMFFCACSTGLAYGGNSIKMTETPGDGMSKIKLTKAERGVVERLANLHFVWPDKWWLAISQAGVHIMRYNEAGEPEYVATVDIPNEINKGAYTENPGHCANCGNLLEPDEGHPSKIYRGPICDSCYDLEKR